MIRLTTVLIAACVVIPAATTVNAQGPEPLSQMTQDLNEWTKELEAELATLASDMWGTQKRLQEKGFRVDRGNKRHNGWWLTANNRNMNPGNIKVQSDGTKIVVTVSHP